MNKKSLALLVCWMALFSGCAVVGPDYHAPETPMPAQWNAGNQAGKDDPQTLAAWWERLEDPVLTSLITRAVSGNLDLQEAAARVRQARAQAGIARAGYFPSVTGQAKYSTSRSSEDTGGGVSSSVYAAGFDASWEVDLFGKTKRSVQAADAAREAEQQSYNNALVSLAAEVATNYVTLRSLQAQLEVARTNLKIQQDTRELVSWRYLAGLTTALDLEQATYQMQETASQIPAMEAEIKSTQNQLDVLLGQAPGGLAQQMPQQGAVPRPPEAIAAGIPAQTLKRRPDVLQAERELAAQTAKVGVAEAELYPSLSFTGTIGTEALTGGGLFDTSNRAAGLVPSLSWTIFDGGAIRKNIEVQNALTEQALLNYRSTILTALQDVENALENYAREKERLAALAQAETAAKNAAQLAMIQYSSGMTAFDEVLTAHAAQLSYEKQRVVSQASVTTYLIALYKALGGGWDPEKQTVKGS